MASGASWKVEGCQSTRYAWQQKVKQLSKGIIRLILREAKHDHIFMRSKEVEGTQRLPEGVQHFVRFGCVLTDTISVKFRNFLLLYVRATWFTLLSSVVTDSSVGYSSHQLCFTYQLGLIVCSNIVKVCTTVQIFWLEFVKGQETVTLTWLYENLELDFANKKPAVYNMNIIPYGSLSLSNRVMCL